MRAGAEVYREVAERCSAYDKSERKSCFCNVADGEKSCLNCRHFAEDEHCRLDLYDPIVKELQDLYESKGLFRKSLFRMSGCGLMLDIKEGG